MRAGAEAAIGEDWTGTRGDAFPEKPEAEIKSTLSPEVVFPKSAAEADEHFGPQYAPADAPARLPPNPDAADILNYVTRRTAQGKGTLVKSTDGTAVFFGFNRKARRAKAAEARAGRAKKRRGKVGK